MRKNNISPPDVWTDETFIEFLGRHHMSKHDWDIVCNLDEESRTQLASATQDQLRSVLNKLDALTNFSALKAGRTTHRSRALNEDLLQPSYIDSSSDFFPPGIYSWDVLLNEPLVACPWPYSEVQFANIIKHLGVSQDNIVQEVIRAARKYLFVERSRINRPTGQNSRDQLSKLIGAIACLRVALKDIGDDAFNHMADHMVGGPYNRHPASESAEVAGRRKALRQRFRQVRAPELVQATLTGIEWSLDRFERDNATALANLPKNRIGAPRRYHDKWLNWRLRHVFYRARPGQKQPQGFLDFFDACALPLGWRRRGPKAMQDLGRKPRPKERKK